MIVDISIAMCRTVQQKRLNIHEFIGCVYRDDGKWEMRPRSKHKKMLEKVQQ